jgi:hypothetical protein
VRSAPTRVALAERPGSGGALRRGALAERPEDEGAPTRVALAERPGIVA